MWKITGSKVGINFQNKKAKVTEGVLEVFFDEFDFFDYSSGHTT